MSDPVQTQRMSAATGPDFDPATGTTRPTSGYARYLLGALFVIYLFNFLDRQLLNLFVEPIKNELGVSDTQMGLLTGLTFALFYSVAGLPLARWADSHSRTSLITVGLVVWSGMTALSGAARSYTHLLLARIGVGVGEASFVPAAHSLITNAFPLERRAGALATLMAGASAGTIIGFIGGGLIHEALGWRATFVILGLAGIPLALVFRLMVGEPARIAIQGAIDSSGAVSMATAVRTLFARRSFSLLAFSAALHAVSSYGATGWYAAFLMRVHEMTVLEAGTVLGVGIGIGSTLGQIIGGRVADRLARRDVHWYVVMPAITSVASVPLFACFLWAWDFGSAIGLYTVASAVGAAWSGPTWAMVQGISPPQMRATASAIVSFLLNLIGMGLGPLAVGALSDLLSPRFGPEALRYALLVIAVPHALAAIASLLARRTLVADLDRAQGEG